jgi:hypothetical protein
VPGRRDLEGSKLLRFLFPSFEKPQARPRFVNIERESHDFRSVGTVLLLAASCGVALAFWEPTHQVTTPFVTASAPRSVTPAVGASKVAGPETTSTADADDDQSTATVKLSTLCSQRATARRDCASVKAVKDARLKAPDPVPVAASAHAPASVPDSAAAPVAASGPAPLNNNEAPRAMVAKAPDPVPASASARTSASVPASAVARVSPSSPAPSKEVPPAVVAAVFAATANVPRPKRPRPVEEAPVERLVRVYDQVLPDGRRIPVYRRAGSGSLELGTIVDGEYRAIRPARRANLEPPGRYFGLQ